MSDALTPEREREIRQLVKREPEVLIPEDAGVLLAEIDRLRTALEDEKKRADEWRKAAGRERCQKCSHSWGPIGKPRGIEEDGYQCVWVCPCDCHADVPALRAALADRDRQLAELRSACQPFVGLMPVCIASVAGKAKRDGYDLLDAWNESWGWPKESLTCGHVRRLAALLPAKEAPVARKNDEVEALAKVLKAEFHRWLHDPQMKIDLNQLLARAAIAHLKAHPVLTIQERVDAINRIGNAKPKRGGKRGK